MRTLLPVTLLLAACGGTDVNVSKFNSEPVATITSPADGSSADEGTPVTFVGIAKDDQTAAAELQVQWLSDLDGTLLIDQPPGADDSTGFTTSALAVGNHTITLSAIDEEGLRTDASILLTINDVPDNPTLQILHPSNGESGRDDVAFTLSVKVSDEQDDAEALIVSITSDLDGELCTLNPDAAGEASCVHTFTAGDHHLEFVVTDLDGLSAADSWAFTVASADSFDDDKDGWTELQGDCDDANVAVHPGAAEIFNGVDDDCNGLVDDHTNGYDDDGDGQTETDGDCDDDDDSVFAGASQTWDGKDNDCDSIVDEGTAYYDDDGDGYTDVAGDCDDGSISVYPSAPELEDGVDNDCDGIIDEGTTVYDDDGDGYSEAAGDCDDTNGTIHPGATENKSNGIDEDCDGIAQLDQDGDGYDSMSTGGADCDDTDPHTFPGAGVNEGDATLCRTDADGDGWADDAPTSGVVAGNDCDDGDEDVSPDADEECDGADNDCDGSVDEAAAIGCTTYYYDSDGDGYGTTTSSCLCTAAGSYTSPYNSDCYDSNSSASPAATTYKTSSRGDGSYDWNCDGTEDKYYDSKSGGCGSWPSCTASTGWKSSSAASCGTAATYVVGCSLPFPYTSCEESTTTYTQKCL